MIHDSSVIQEVQLARLESTQHYSRPHYRSSLSIFSFPVHGVGGVGDHALCPALGPAPRVPASRGAARDVVRLAGGPGDGVVEVVHALVRDDLSGLDELSLRIESTMQSGPSGRIVGLG